MIIIFVLINDVVYVSYFLDEHFVIKFNFLMCYCFWLVQVCDVIDRVLKSPQAPMLKDLHPVSTLIAMVT